MSRAAQSIPYLLAGAVAFAAAQAVLFLVAGDRRGWGIDSQGWFLNSAAGIIVMAVVAGSVSATVLGTWPASTIWKGWMAFVAGAGLALITAVFALGPGTIFPIVIVAGLVVVGVGALAGSAIAVLLLRRHGMR